MRNLKFSELAFPRGLNLALLTEVLPEEKLMEFILKYSGEQRLKRRIVLPSHQTVKKVFCYHIWSLIQKGKITWDEVKADFKKECKSLKVLDITKHEIKRLYTQRLREILREEGK